MPIGGHQHHPWRWTNPHFGRCSPCPQHIIRSDCDLYWPSFSARCLHPEIQGKYQEYICHYDGWLADKTIRELCNDNSAELLLDEAMKEEPLWVYNNFTNLSSYHVFPDSLLPMGMAGAKDEQATPVDESTTWMANSIEWCSSHLPVMPSNPAALASALTASAEPCSSLACKITRMREIDVQPSIHKWQGATKTRGDGGMECWCTL